MTYTVDKNPPPIDFEYAGRGPHKGKLRVALESMKPGDGMHIPDHTSARVTTTLYSVKLNCTYKFVVRKDDFGGCYVWCLDPSSV